MKCQSCGKKEATVKYYEDINGKKQELHFCMDCAKKLGVTDFANLLSPMFVTIPDYKHEDELYCKNCGYRLEDYARTGMFGCPECYNTFEDSLDELFYKLHGKNRHVKINKIKKIDLGNKDEKIEDLKFKLQELVKEEKYEEAAVVRDKIKELEGK